jgi:hypothetical protein
MYIEKRSDKFCFGNMCVCFIHVSVSDLYIPTIGLPILLQEKMWTDFFEYINRSQTNDCRNKDRGCAIPFLGKHKWNFRCRAQFIVCQLPMSIVTCVFAFLLFLQLLSHPEHA